MKNIYNYIYSLLSGIVSLVSGMRITLKEFFTKKITEEYPENRKTLKMYDRYRGELEFVYNDDNTYKCIACGLCQSNCPNGTLHLTSKMVDDGDGKKHKELISYKYDLGSCIFCQLCVMNCPTGAIRFNTTFEHAVFTREKLVKELKHEGSSLQKK